MAELPGKPITLSSQPSWLKPKLLKAAWLIVAGLLLGWIYDWGSSRLYGEKPVAGFRLGILHGGLMPAALPSLLLGRDVPIYATNNTGRAYKLGYIAGINLCGLVFFGLAFRRAAPERTSGHAP